MKKIEKIYEKEFNNFEAAGLIKEESEIKHVSPTRLKIGKLRSHFINFTSNDCLSLSTHEGLNDFTFDKSLHSHSSRLLTGTLEAHKNLELRIAHLYSQDDCIVFNSGYEAMMGLFDCLLKENDSLFLDKSSTSHMVDAARLCFAKKYTFDDPADLEFQCKKTERTRFRALSIDSVNHITGEKTAVEHFWEVSKRYQCLNVLNDSLNLGLSDEYNDENVDLYVGNLAQNLGGMSGGFITGSSELINWLRQMSRTFQLCDPMSTYNAIMLEKIFEFIEKKKTLVDDLTNNIQLFQELLNDSKWKHLGHNHPIQNIIIGDVINTQNVVNALFKNGIIVEGLCYPSVAKDTARIRIRVCATHKKSDFKDLIECMNIARDKFKD